MLANGWRVDDTLGWDGTQYLAAHHAISLPYGSDGGVDLHVGLLSTDRSPHLDAELIAGSVTATLAGQEVQVLGGTEQLMHTMSHSNPYGLRHLADSLYLLRQLGDDIDWQLIGDQIIERRSTARVLDNIDQLTQVYPAAVPQSVTHRLRNANRHWSDWSYQHRPMRSAEGPKIFASRLAQRSRGAGPREKLRIARLLARQYAHAAGIHTARDVMSYIVSDRRGPKR